MKKIAWILTAALLFGCSSAPKDDGTMNDIKNRAAEYAEFGNRYYHAADYTQALKFFTQALEMNLSVDNETGVVESHGSLGRVYMRTGDMEAAEEHFLKAHELASYLSGNMKLKTCGNLGEYWLIRGDIETSLEYINRGLTYTSDSPESKEAAVLYHNAATVYKQKEDYQRAFDYVERALKINTAMASYSEMAANYYLLSSIASKQSRVDEALKNAHEALKYDKKIENQVGIAADLFALGRLYKMADRVEESFRYFEKAYHVYEAINLASGVRDTLEYLAEIAENLGKDRESELYRGALELLEQKTQ